MTVRPALFIGSSSESLEIAYALQKQLQHVAEVTVWNQGVFELSRTALESLADTLERSDFGAFVFSPDDVLIMRGQERPTVRDNVIFELGLFIGRLGTRRSFIVAPHGQVESMRLPSDLLGLTTARYDAARQDGDLEAALGPPSYDISKAIAKLGFLSGPHASKARQAETPPVEYSSQDIVIMLTSWMGQRPAGENSQAIHFAKVDKELELPAGSAKRYLKEAAKHWNYVVANEGEQTILFREGRQSPSRSGRLFIAGY